MLSANAIRIGFLVGCFDRTDVDEWVTAAVTKLAPVPAELLELVPLVGLDDSEIASRLSSVAGPQPLADEVRLRIDAICERFRRGRSSLEEAALQIESTIAFHGRDLPEELARAGAGLHDVFSLAITGSYGTVEQAEAEVREFVEEFGRPMR